MAPITLPSTINDSRRGQVIERQQIGEEIGPCRETFQSKYYCHAPVFSAQ
jgi:hypothetical protein